MSAGADDQAAGNRQDRSAGELRSQQTQRNFKAFLSWDAKAGKVGFEFEPRAAKAPAAKKAAAKKGRRQEGRLT